MREKSVTEERRYPLGGKYENRDYVPDSGIYIVPNWPEPEIKGHGTVRTKDGLIKDDTNGGNIKQRSGISGG